MMTKEEKNAHIVDHIQHANIDHLGENINQFEGGEMIEEDKI